MDTKSCPLDRTASWSLQSLKAILRLLGGTLEIILVADPRVRLHHTTHLGVYPRCVPTPPIRPRDLPAAGHVWRRRLRTTVPQRRAFPGMVPTRVLLCAIPPFFFPKTQASSITIQPYLDDCFRLPSISMCSSSERCDEMPSPPPERDCSCSTRIVRTAVHGCVLAPGFKCLVRYNCCRLHTQGLCIPLMLLVLYTGIVHPGITLVY